MNILASCAMNTLATKERHFQIKPQCVIRIILHHYIQVKVYNVYQTDTLLSAMNRSKLKERMIYSNADLPQYKTN